MLDHLKKCEEDMITALTTPWCKYKLDPNSYKHKNGLPEAVIAFLEPVFEDLANEELPFYLKGVEAVRLNIKTNACQKNIATSCEICFKALHCKMFRIHGLRQTSPSPEIEKSILLEGAQHSYCSLAERASGGGTVYHDEGNLNLSFLMSRPRYNRRANLDLIVEALVRKWDIDLAVNQRNDIMLERFYKVSGTAARLGRSQSFHHCTLLMSVDQGMLLKSLDSPMLGVESKATKSVPSSVMNLKDKVPEMTFELLSEVIGQHFLSGSHSPHNADKFEFIHPLDNIKYPGVDKILARLLSWQWIYGKTPAFTIHRKFVGVAFHELCTLEVVIKAEQGKLTSLTVALQNDIVKDKLDSFVQSTLSFYTNYFLREEVLLTPQSISDMQQKYSKIVSETFSNSPEAIQLAKWLSDSVTSCFNFV
ncbi:lipoyltransferase 1, mitochondrial [Biomphalaria glabrata]|nr:lipoyltransferase 1, mitochondrial [Biomphalaria glabrata]